MVDQAGQFLLEFWAILTEMAPYLLFGFLIAGLFSVFIPASWIERHLGGRGFWPVLKATAFGIPLPLCSCGVIPVSASLRRHGATRGATAAFLISTPQTGVDSILVTFSLLGWVFAVFKPIAALVNGVIGGMAVNLFEPARENAVDKSLEECRDACCSTSQKGNRLSRAIRYGFITLPEDIGMHLLVGLILAGLISVVLPEYFFAQYLGTGILAMVVMMLAGIPVYVCATASIPIAAAMIDKGVTPGAALVFLMTGPATNAAAIAAIWKVLGRRTTLVYLVSVAVTALASGLVLDYIFHVSKVTPGPYMPWMIPETIKNLSGVALLAALAYAIYRARTSSAIEPTTPESSAEQVILSVRGMTCSHCAEAVRHALESVPGVRNARVDLKNKQAAVFGHDLDTNRLTDVVQSLGYEVDGADRTGASA